MSRPTVLCVALSAEKLRHVRLACMRLSLLMQVAEGADLCQPLGALCGLAPRQPDAPAPDAPFPGEMLVMANLNRQQAERLLAALKQARVHLPLKAVLTPTNATWDCFRLHQGLTAERSALQGGVTADHTTET